MIGRERFLAAINRELPDSVPKYAEFTPRQLQVLGEKTGNDDPADYIPPETPWENILAFFDVVDEFGRYV